MKHIVIAGGGFAGTNCALQLDKLLPKSTDVEITVVDRNPYHLAPTYLYEVATSPEELTTLAQLKQSVALPLEDIFAGTRVKFRKANIKQIDADKNEVTLDQGKLGYDYLVLALGSTSNFYGIPGADKYAIPLKSLRDGFAIRNRIQFLLDAHRMDTTKKTIRLVVAGGGFAGVELAGELKGLLDFLAWKESYPRHKLEVLVVEGTNQLMPGMDEFVGKDVYDRLKSLGTEVMLNSMISNVDENFIEFKDGEKISYDALIWTAGVKATQAPFADMTKVKMDRGGRLLTNGTFQVEQYPNIFSAGDEGCYMDKNGRPLPGTARQAIDQGRYIGHALARIVQNKKPAFYVCKTYGYIVPVGGKWAIFRTPRFYMKGSLAYVVRQLAWFHYFWTLLGLRRAIQLSILENRLYGRNDD
jgi:NADH:quinone reductase (non-electrogenic)